MDLSLSLEALFGVILQGVLAALGTSFVDKPSADRAYANDVVELFQGHDEQERIADLQRAGEATRVARQKELDDERIEKERGAAAKKAYDDKMKKTEEAKQDPDEREARGETGYQGQLECPQC